MNTDHMPLRFTKHAESRCQQRGIPRAVVQVLYRFGKRTYNEGAEVYFMNKVSRQRAKNYLSKEEFKKVQKWLDVYIVIESSLIITVARRGKCFKVG